MGHGTPCCCSASCCLPAASCRAVPMLACSRCDSLARCSASCAHSGAQHPQAWPPCHPACSQVLTPLPAQGGHQVLAAAAGGGGRDAAHAGPRVAGGGAPPQQHDGGCVPATPVVPPAQLCLWARAWVQLPCSGAWGPYCSQGTVFKAVGCGAGKLPPSTSRPNPFPTPVRPRTPLTRAGPPPDRLDSQDRWLSGRMPSGPMGSGPMPGMRGPPDGRAMGRQPSGRRGGESHPACSPAGCRCCLGLNLCRGLRSGVHLFKLHSHCKVGH